MRRPLMRSQLYDLVDGNGVFRFIMLSLDLQCVRKTESVKMIFMWLKKIKAKIPDIPIGAFPIYTLLQNVVHIIHKK